MSEEQKDIRNNQSDLKKSQIEPLEMKNKIAEMKFY